MRPAHLLVAVTLAVACTPAEPPANTAAAAPAASTLIPDLLRDVGEVEQKLVDLAKAIPADKYGYRPGAGVRSVGEVVLHVASDNYFMPAAIGTAAPAATGITGDNYETTVAYEKRAVSPDSAVKELQASFAFLKQAMQAQAPAALEAKSNMFGSEYTGQQVWIMATTHLHEHLGQMIAYARANNIVPPWSK
ncbi:MAG: DinB family protein [Gemmatimonadetes bacterium]|nr:DinB family protein [Gemmatimonadota bacterium]